MRLVKLREMCVRKGQGLVDFVEEAFQIDKSLWKGICVYADCADGRLHRVTFELCGKARELAAVTGHPVYGLVIGHNTAACVEQLRHYGVDRVFVYDHPEFADFRIEPYTAAFYDFIKKEKPSSVLVGATIGGNISTNAGGMRAVKYGVTRDYVRSLTVVLPNGEIQTFGAAVAKNSSGYSLKDLIVGSEGTLAVICNVVINAKHEVVGAFAGDCEQAHLAGTEFLKELCGCAGQSADIVITSNNGYPLDQNIYQAVKGMTAAEATCKEGGVIIMVARCNDGHGGESFMRTISAEQSAADILAQIQATPKESTVPDQWESQILARILSRFHVVLISEADPQMVRAMKMHPATDIDQALTLADTLLGHPGSITVIPEGISTIIA